VADAELILHVVDASSDQAPAHVAEVLRVLREIGAAATPQILVLNKSDRFAAADADPALIAARLLGDSQKQGTETPAIPAVLVSGLTGQGLTGLLETIDRALPFDPIERVSFRIPLRDGAAIANIHEYGRVRTERYFGNVCEMEADAPESLCRRWRRYLIHSSSVPVENSVNN
jgi:GTPase